MLGGVATANGGAAHGVAAGYIGSLSGSADGGDAPGPFRATSLEDPEDEGRAGDFFVRLF
jgi:hypothetical protein